MAGISKEKWRKVRRSLGTRQATGVEILHATEIAIASAIDAITTSRFST